MDSDKDDVVIDLLTEAWEIYEQTLNERDNADYYINKEQMQKVIAAYKFFDKVTSEAHGKLERFQIQPKEITAGITAYCTLFYFDSKQIGELCEILNNAVSLSIDATIDGEVCISFTIPDVYRHK